MHLKSLKIFCDVVSRRSFSRAADENRISQSGASQIVNQVEAELGVRLIDRSKRPFVLTPEGEVYYEGCRRLVQGFHALEEEVRTLHQAVEGRVSVAAIYSVGLGYGKRFADAFTTRHPKATVHIQYEHPDDVYESVEEGRVDLGLVSYAHSTRTIKATPWLDEPMVLVCSADHPLAQQKKPVKLADLDGLKVIGFAPELTIRRKIDRELSGLRLDVQVVMAFDNIDTIKRAIEINSGASFLPEPSVAREVASGALVAIRPEGFHMNRPLGIIGRRGVELGKTARRFVQLLQDEAGQSVQLKSGDGTCGNGAEASTAAAKHDSAVVGNTA